LLISSFFFFWYVCVQKYHQLAYAKKQKKEGKGIDCLFVDGKFTFHVGRCIYEDKCLLFASFGCDHTITIPNHMGSLTPLLVYICICKGLKTKMCPEINFMSKYPEIIF
jgi:hypothetical protein